MWLAFVFCDFYFSTIFSPRFTQTWNISWRRWWYFPHKKELHDLAVCYLLQVMNVIVSWMVFRYLCIYIRGVSFFACVLWTSCGIDCTESRSIEATQNAPKWSKIKFVRWCLRLLFCAVQFTWLLLETLPWQHMKRTKHFGSDCLTGLRIQVAARNDLTNNLAAHRRCVKRTESHDSITKSRLTKVNLTASNVNNSTNLIFLALLNFSISMYVNALKPNLFV